MDNADMYTVEDAAQLFHVAEAAILRAIRSGSLPIYSSPSFTGCRIRVDHLASCFTGVTAPAKPKAAIKRDLPAGWRIIK